jgi:uncharacterized protein YegL
MSNDKTTMDKHTLDASRYGFSGARIDGLGATEYTLVGVVADVSGSVSSYRNEIELCVKEAVSSCRASPRADNLMLRFTTFDARVQEIHGFKPLAACNLDDYTDSIQIGGTTALYDAATNMLSSIASYAQHLGQNGFECNAIVFVITDGEDNTSTLDARAVARAMQDVITTEALESISSVLIGANVHGDALSIYLNRLRKDAGFSQYIELDDANAATLNRLATFLSFSIQAQSQALTSGAGSSVLTF